MDLEQRSFGRTTEQNDLTKGERVASFFQDDMLVPARYFDDRRGKTLLEPETRLMFAVLEDAVRCFQENCSARYGERKRLFNQAQGWIFEVRDDWVFGFENICSVLELNADYIRKGLKRWKEKELSKLGCAPLLKRSTLNNSPSRRIESDMGERSLAS
jgi:hypothetical protein